MRLMSPTFGPFHAASGRAKESEQIDWLTEENAHILAANIVAYWRREGYEIEAPLVHPGSKSGSRRSTFWCVRLRGFVNGMPAAACKRGSDD